MKIGTTLFAVLVFIIELVPTPAFTAEEASQAVDSRKPNIILFLVDDLDRYYSTSNLPLRGAKGWLYEGGIRVPLIIKWPGQGKAGAICREPVIGTDYYPTILEMVGIPPIPQQHVDGESLVPLFRGQTTLGREALYWHFPHYSNHGMQSPGGAIRCGRYKLLEYFENGTVQLFDLESDLEEQNDLSRRHPEIAAQLLKKLHQWQKAVGAEMMGPNPGFDGNARADEMLRTTVGSETTVNRTRNIQINLSQYAGSEILLELINQANGWSYEAAYWGKIAIGQ